MGAEYVRDSEVPSIIEVSYIRNKIIKIANLYAVQTFGNIIAIHFRQQPAAELSWVTIVQGDPTLRYK